MIHIDASHTEPFRRYEAFHEQMSISLKVMTAAIQHMLKSVKDSLPGKQLGILIQQADPSWRYPPVWDSSEDLENKLPTLVGRLGVVSVWSALDDFRVGVEAEIDRWESFSESSVARTLEPNSPEDATESGIPHSLIRRYHWDSGARESELAVLGYFSLVRNCIAHRDSRASRALSILSKSGDLNDAVSKVSGRNDLPLPVFEPEGEVHVRPKSVILYSHLCREIARDIDSKLKALLGPDGFLNMVASHAIRYYEIAKPSPASPSILLNRTLNDWYSARLDDTLEPTARMKELNLWERFRLQFENCEKGRPGPAARLSE